MNHEREADMTEIEDELHNARFDDELQEQINLSQYSVRDNAIRGTIQEVRTGDKHNQTALVEVTLPLENDDRFIEELADSTGDVSLQTTKLGRLIDEHGYSRDTPHHLINDTVDCIYRDGEWSIVDPDPKKTASHSNGYGVQVIGGENISVRPPPMEQKDDDDKKEHPFGEPTRKNIVTFVIFAGFFGGGGLLMEESVAIASEMGTKSAMEMAVTTQYVSNTLVLVSLLFVVMSGYQLFRNLNKESV